VTKTHGTKQHFQVLLDPHRAALLEQEAVRRGFRAAAYARELIYTELERTAGSGKYEAALTQDAEERKAAIQRQVEGRLRGRKTLPA
jgi:hypothetical protein